MCIYSTDSVVQLRIADLIGTNLWILTMRWYAAGVRNNWISEGTVALLQSRRKILVNFQSNGNRRKINHQVKCSIRAEHEAWKTKKAKNMEAVKNAVNVRTLFQIIRTTGSRKLTVRETIKDRQGILISNKKNDSTDGLSTLKNNSISHILLSNRMTSYYRIINGEP